MDLYELKKKLKIARERCFIFNQIKSLTKKVYSNLSNRNIYSDLKLQISIMHRHFFLKKHLKIQYK